MPGDLESVQSGLLAWLRDERPRAQALRVDGLRRVGGGMSTHNWLFDACWQSAGREVREPLVLRQAAPSEIVETEREHEFLLLRSLEGRGLRAPRALWMDAAGAWTGAPSMILERMSGRSDRGLLTDRNTMGLDVAARMQIAGEMADELARLHAIDVDEVPHLAEPLHSAPAAVEMRRQQEIAEREDLVQEPELVLAAAWLHAHAPVRPAREVIVHGDWRPANMLVDAGHLSAVLDWELAHRGDPAEDLGWYLAAVYRHEHLVPGHWWASDFLARYASHGGAAVDLAAVRFWSVFAMYKLAVIACLSMRSLAAGDSGRLGPPPSALLELLMRAISMEQE